jgi:oxygen-dependent protoporphyrinogen oxidase
MNRIAVVGGGISGIAASHYLLKAGHQVVLYERSTAIGGRMLTAELAGRRFAIGGKNVGV